MEKDRDIIKNLLRKDFRTLIDWFFEKYMVLNVITCASVEIPKIIKYRSLNLITYF